jgi:probable rRNA maturation factor
VEGRDDRSEPDVPVDLERWCDLLGSVLAAEGVPERAEAALLLVDPTAIAELAATHLGHDGPTDVLSFPLDGVGPVTEGLPWVVGDVVLCPRVAADQAGGHAGDLESEVALLVTHGGLHLCGWDHDGDEDRAAMWARERTLLAELHGPFPADPWAATGEPAAAPEGRGAR